MNKETKTDWESGSSAGLPYAHFGWRLLGFLIDTVWVVILFYLLGKIFFGLFAATPMPLEKGLLRLPFVFLLSLFFYVNLEARGFWRFSAARVLRLRLVLSSGGPASIAKKNIRIVMAIAVFMFVCLLVPLLRFLGLSPDTLWFFFTAPFWALVFVLMTKKKQTLYDLISGTVVLRETKKEKHHEL